MFIKLPLQYDEIDSGILTENISIKEGFFDFTNVLFYIISLLYH